MSFKRFALFLVVLLILSIEPASASQIYLKNPNECDLENINPGPWKQQYNGDIEPPSYNPLIKGAIEGPEGTGPNGNDIEHLYPNTQTDNEIHGQSSGSTYSSKLIKGAIEEPSGATPSHIDIEGLYQDTQTGFSTEKRTRDTVIIVAVVVTLIVITIISYGTLTGPAAEAAGETGELVGGSEAAGGAVGGSGAAVNSIISGSNAAGKGIGLTEVVQTGSEIIAGVGVLRTVTTILKNQKKSTNQDTESQVTNNMPLQSPRILTKQKINTQSGSLDAVEEEEVNTKPKTQPIQEDDEEINGEQEDSKYYSSSMSSDPEENENNLRQEVGQLFAEEMVQGDQLEYQAVQHFIETAKTDPEDLVQICVSMIANGLTSQIAYLFEAVILADLGSASYIFNEMAQTNFGHALHLFEVMILNDLDSTATALLESMIENGLAVHASFFLKITQNEMIDTAEILELIEPQYAAAIFRDYPPEEAITMLAPLMDEDTYHDGRERLEEILNELEKWNSDLANKIRNALGLKRYSSKEDNSVESSSYSDAEL